MTVAELKKILNDVPDDCTVTVEYWNRSIGWSEQALVESANQDVSYHGIGSSFCPVLAIKAQKNGS